MSGSNPAAVAFKKSLAADIFFFPLLGKFGAPLKGNFRGQDRVLIRLVANKNYKQKAEQDTNVFSLVLSK
jgi:hypothetical protein